MNRARTSSRLLRTPVSALLLSLSVLARLCPSATGQAPSERIRVVSRPDQAAFSIQEGKRVDLRSGDSIPPGSRVGSGKKTMDFRTPRVAYVRMRANTETTAPAPDPKSQDVVMDHKGGTLLVRISKKLKELNKESRLIIRTRSVTCIAEGTRFAVEADDVSATVTVEEGVVSVAPVGQPQARVQVQRNQKLATRGGVPQNLENLDIHKDSPDSRLLLELRDLPPPDDGVTPIKDATGIHTAAVWDAIAGPWRKHQAYYAGGLVAVAFTRIQNGNPDINALEQSVLILQAATGEPVARLSDQKGRTAAMTMRSKDVNLNVFTTGTNGAIRLWQVTDPWDEKPKMARAASSNRAPGGKGTRRANAVEAFYSQDPNDDSDDKTPEFKVFNETPAAAPITCAYFPTLAPGTPDYVMMGTAAGEVVAISPTTGAPMAFHQKPTGAVTALEVGPAAGMDTGFTYIWDWDNRKDSYVENPVTIRGHTGRVTYVGISGRQVVTAGADGFVRFWAFRESNPDFDTARKRVFPMGFPLNEQILRRTWIFDPVEQANFPAGGPVASVIFRGNRMLVGREDGGIVSFITSGALMGKRVVFDGHKQPILALAFSADGKRLISVAPDGIGTWWLDN